MGLANLQDQRYLRDAEPIIVAQREQQLILGIQPLDGAYQPRQWIMQWRSLVIRLAAPLTGCWRGCISQSDPRDPGNHH